MGDLAEMPCTRKILVVDGDSAMRETLREQLTLDDAFTVVEAAGAHEAERHLLDGTRFDAVIMDAVLPDGDGHSVFARLRANGLAVPVILMNGADGSSGDDMVAIAKPFRLSELMAHLRARLDAQAKIEELIDAGPIRIGPYQFSQADKALHHTAADRRVRLTEKEVAILAFLHRKAARAVPRDELLREVWGYNPAVTTHTLETHIYRLRRKIEADPANASLLVTEAGGYRLASG